jgi:hypothetical protein
MLTKLERILDNIIGAMAIVFMLFGFTSFILLLGGSLLWFVLTFIPILTYPLVILYVLAFFVAIYYPKVANR